MKWTEAIVQVLREEGGALHVSRISQLAMERGYRPWHKTAHQTVSEKCQRDRLRFKKAGRNTFRLSDRWLNAEKMIQSMITVKAGSTVSPALRAEAIPRGRGIHCQARACKATTNLHVHHVHPKAEVLQEIVCRHHLRFRPHDRIENILKAFDLLMQHPKFRNKEYVRVYCAKHHKELTKCARARQRRDSGEQPRAFGVRP
ncbi:MAG TPA: winged helix-turn-helix domain-containing protein [Planctomycetota bacterium]|nr:winged helix-turn-helix domain-containing protein [Planctomycetota bacterium]